MKTLLSALRKYSLPSSSAASTARAVRVVAARSTAVTAAALSGNSSDARPPTAVANASSAPARRRCAAHGASDRSPACSSDVSNQKRRSRDCSRDLNGLFNQLFQSSCLLVTGLLVVLARALLGLGVVVAALQRHPVSLDVLAARQEVRPGVARHQALRSARPCRTGHRRALRR